MIPTILMTTTGQEQVGNVRNGRRLVNLLLLPLVVALIVHVSRTTFCHLSDSAARHTLALAHSLELTAKTIKCLPLSPPPPSTTPHRPSAQRPGERVRV